MARVAIHAIMGGANPDNRHACQRSVESILRQKTTDFTLFLANGLSVDEESIAWCRSLARNDSRIVYSQPEAKIKDFGQHYRRCFYRSIGFEFMISPHFHGVWPPDFLGEAVRALEERPEAAVAFSPCQFLAWNKDAPYGLGATMGPGPDLPPGPTGFAFDLSTLNTADRVAALVREMDFPLLNYGLVRMKTLLDHKFPVGPIGGHISSFSLPHLNSWAFSGVSAAPVSLALALAGPAVQIPGLIYNLPMAADLRQLWSVEAARMKLDHLPVYNMFNFLCSLAAGAALDPEEKNRLLPALVKSYLGRFRDRMEAELAAHVQGRAQWALRSLMTPGTVRTEYLELNAAKSDWQRLTRMKNFSPEVPYLDLALGLTLERLNRYLEAAAAFSRYAAILNRKET